MKIEEIELKKPYHLLRIRTERCSKEVRSGASTEFNPSRNKCDRHARYKIDGIPYCTQHAGNIALKHLMKKEIP